MKMKKTLAFMTAAAIGISSFAALASSAAADEPDYGTKTTNADGSIVMNVGSDSITQKTYGSIIAYEGELKRTESLSDKLVGSDYIAELTFNNIDSLSSFDSVDILVGCQNDVQLTVNVGGTEVAQIDNINNGSWANPSVVTAVITNTSASGNVTLFLKNLAPDSNHYMGNFVTVKFYNQTATNDFGAVYDGDSGSKIFGMANPGSLIKGTAKNWVNTSYGSRPDSLQGNDNIAELRMHYIDLSTTNFNKAVICAANGGSSDYSVKLKVGNTVIAECKIAPTGDWNTKELPPFDLTNTSAKGYLTLEINHQGQTYAGNYEYVKLYHADVDARCTYSIAVPTENDQTKGIAATGVAAEVTVPSTSGAVSSITWTATSDDDGIVSANYTGAALTTGTYIFGLVVPKAIAGNEGDTVTGEINCTFE